MSGDTSTGLTDSSPNATAADEVDGDAVTPLPDGGPIATLTDPASLRDRDDVEFVADTHDGEREFHDADVAGRAVVGLTNDAGEVLLLEHPEQPPILPMCTLDSGDDWAAVGRGTVDNVRGLTVDLDRVERVRALTYEADGETHTNYYVVFRASVAPDGTLPADPTIDDPEWGVDWYDEVPPEADGSLAEDIRLFLD